LVRFLSADDPKSQVFVVDADGSLRQVTGVSGAFGATRPVWSPDGSQIAFTGPKVGSVGVNGQIALVSVDGSGERLVAEGQFPQWSPDGSRIAFTEVDDVTGEELSLFLLDVGSGKITDLGLGYSARWMGNGDRLSFNANSFTPEGLATSALYVLTLDGGKRQRLAESTEGFPSPDGSALLFVHDGVISVASADGSRARELTNGSEPVWSPDGTRIVFTHDYDQAARPLLAVMDLDGKTLWSDVAGSMPTWSPDGALIAMEVVGAESSSVQVIEAASGNLLWQTDGMQPAWAP
jgi:TolB protein